MNLLGKQASELRAAEMGIYNCKVKVEQVIMENSRLHLCIRQMTQDVSRVREDRQILAGDSPHQAVSAGHVGAFTRSS